ncbi:unnamed protein product [Ostreobium quekettii]|uniref:Uncharacterized protein n=1 Tax=Ostreobium quekettii TaxID=121088 RepID=A0A8S1IQT1_9CHLO|nr:unnamed protein product [Ostreobium quekettii]|eukprot:evm.model.scf_191.4 EVM.evm.TU.scf_191.4   scf_191:24120-27019(-)
MSTSSAAASICADGAPGEASIAEEPAGHSRMRKSSSSPVLSTLGIPEGRLEAGGAEGDSGLNVYVVARAIERGGPQMLHSLSKDAKNAMVPLGVCHYMTVFETSDGRLVQFDFGPAGGDVHKGVPVSWVAGAERGEEGKAGLGGRHGVEGEIREHQLAALPEEHLFIGHTPLRLSDIRSYNAVQPLHYELHSNDCRHYVNSLVHFTTGVDGASVQLVRETYRRRHARPPALSARAVQFAQYFTDVANWGRVKAASGTTLATLLAAWSGRGLVGRMASNTLTPALRAVSVSKSLTTVITKNPVAGAAAAVAATTPTWADAPLIRETVSLGSAMNRGLMSAAGSAAGWLDWLRAQGALVDLASASSRGSRGGGALGPGVVSSTAAVAVAVTRGAAGLLMRGRSERHGKRKARRRAVAVAGVGRGLQLGRPPRLARPALQSNE